ncbi:MAG: hypothetical protein ACJ75S_07000 [Solirubrobacterales bacterium]|jgi:hypothetical protein
MTGKLVAVLFRGNRFFESGTARKDATCWNCRKKIHKGDPTFRPLGNGADRMRRLHAACAEAIAADGNECVREEAVEG